MRPSFHLCHNFHSFHSSILFSIKPMNFTLPFFSYSSPFCFFSLCLSLLAAINPQLFFFHPYILFFLLRKLNVIIDSFLIFVSKFYPFIHVNLTLLPLPSPDFKDIDNHAEVLIYDSSEMEDMEVVVENIKHLILGDSDPCDL